LPCYEKDGREFLHNILTADETWVRHYEPESKRQSVEYHHKGSPAEKIKNPASAGKLMAPAFWDERGFTHMEFLEPGTTIKSERFMGTLKTFETKR
jgi:hypothetical protein